MHVGNGETVVQGCWLDWPQLKTRLLAEAADLLPEADLVPVNGDAAADPSRMLAGLPVRLVVDEAWPTLAVGPTLRWALWMGWGAVLLARAGGGGAVAGRDDAERAAGGVCVERDARAADAAHDVSHVRRDAGPRHGAGRGAAAGVFRDAAARRRSG